MHSTRAAFAILLAAFFLPACGQQATATEAPLIHEVSSKHSVEEVSKRLVSASKNHKFGVVATHKLTEIMKKKGVSFERELVVVEVCNPHHAKTVLTADINVSTALPCRISVYRTGDSTTLATMAPSRMIETFGRKELQDVAATVQKSLYAIMAEAAQ